jgi:hypothetical protein
MSGEVGYLDEHDKTGFNVKSNVTGMKKGKKLL